MGTVYLAVARGPAGFSKLKVVKRLRPELAADPQFLEMFLGEARLTARLNHANIAQTNEVGFDGEHYFIEMEFLEGQSLDALARRTAQYRELPVHVGIYVVAQALAGLHYAHEAKRPGGDALGVVHRDVSPHNVFVTYDGGVKVLDFGIAKAADSSVDTRTGIVKGKATYMAPEQAARQPVDRRADVYGMGIILWQILARRRLWAGLSDPEIFVALERGGIDPPSQHEPGVHPALERICMKALAHDRADRFATAAEMQIALEEHLVGERIQVGARQVAALMEDLFREARAKLQAQIEARLARIERTPSDEQTGVDVPVVATSAAPFSVAGGQDLDGGTVRTTSELRGPALPETRVERAAKPPPRRSRAMIAAGTAVVLASIGTVVVWSAARREQQGAPASHVPSAAAAPVPGCASARECSARLGTPAVCRDGCVPLAGDGDDGDCKPLADPAAMDDDRTIWVGAMFPTRGADATLVGRINVNALEVGRRDFSSIADGIPSARPGEKPRALGLLVCDDSVDATRAARHLVERVRVPAVIGFYRSKELIDLASDLFIPHRTMAVSSLNASSLITSIPHPSDSPRMIWRTTLSTSQLAVPIASVVSDVFEHELRAAGGALRGGGAMRVALVRLDNATGVVFSDAVVSSLRYNGKSVTDNGRDFREIVYADPSKGTIDYGALVAKLLEFRPHVVIYDDRYFIEGGLAQFEAAWPKDERFRPFYVERGVPHWNALYEFVGHDAGRRRRFFGVDLPASLETNVKFTLRYNELFDPPETRNTAPSVSYDAFYVVAYALYAALQAGADPLDGAALSRAVARLVPPGTPVDVGPAHIYKAFNVLHDGGNVDLNGAATKLDFNLTTGDVSTDLAVLCLDVDGSGAAFDVAESGLFYRAASGKLEGTLRCP
jgi:serine/threonine-protein kinase